MDASVVLIILAIVLGCLLLGFLLAGRLLSDGTDSSLPSWMPKKPSDYDQSFWRVNGW